MKCTLANFTMLWIALTPGQSVAEEVYHRTFGRWELTGHGGGAGYDSVCVLSSGIGNSTTMKVNIFPRDGFEPYNTFTLRNKRWDTSDLTGVRTFSIVFTSDKYTDHLLKGCAQKTDDGKGYIFRDATDAFWENFTKYDTMIIPVGDNSMTVVDLKGSKTLGNLVDDCATEVEGGATE